MGIPDLSTLCTEYDVETGFPVSAGVTFDPFQLEIAFPGGGKLSGVMSAPTQAAFDILGQLNSALMPLQPVFDIIDAVMSVKKVFDAVASNPFSIASALPDLLKKVDIIAGFIPQLAVPKMLLGTIDVIIASLASLKVELQALADAQLRISAATAKAEAIGGSVAINMAIVTSCAQSQLDMQVNILQKKAAPLNRLIGILNILAGIVGIELPSIDGGGGISELVDALDSVIDAMTTVRSAIPV